MQHLRDYRFLISAALLFAAAAPAKLSADDNKSNTPMAKAASGFLQATPGPSAHEKKLMKSQPAPKGAWQQPGTQQKSQPGPPLPKSEQPKSYAIPTDRIDPLPKSQSAPKGAWQQPGTQQKSQPGPPLPKSEQPKSYAIPTDRPDPPLTGYPLSATPGFQHGLTLGGDTPIGGQPGLRPVPR
jgi:hypothetical protein